MGFRFIWPNAPVINSYVIDKAINCIAVFALPFATVFMRAREIAPRLARLSRYLTLGIVVVTLCSVSLPYGILVKLSIVNISLAISLAFVITGVSISKRQREGFFFGAAWTAFLVGAIVLALNKLGLIPRNVLTENALQLASIIEMLLLSFALADQMNDLRKKLVIANSRLESSLGSIEFFNKNLEKLVASKTKEIRSLLDNVPQGICCIDKSGKILPDYSAHLVEILGRSDLTGCHIVDAILQNTDLGYDQRNQAVQSLNASLMGTSLDFFVNSSKLPLEFSYRFDGKEKFLKATWSEVTDADDEVQQIMLTLLDVTVEKNLEMAALEQKVIFKKINELVNLKAQNVALFFESASPVIRQGFELIRNSESGADSSQKLFNVAHTLKGESRTLQLQSLTESIHRAEDMFSAVQSGGYVSEVVLESAWKVVQQEFENYVQINRNMLNRGDELSKVHLDRAYLQQHYVRVSSLLDADRDEFGKVAAYLKQHVKELEAFLFEGAGTVFESYAEAANRIARDLGKARPALEISVPDMPIPKETRVLLDKCMTHILRNALDHGIENADERKNRSKSPAGTIRIQGDLTSHFLVLTIADDGRGLNIGKLRQKGMEKGLISPNSTMEEIADLVFASGLSTADVLTAVSGRGVGMGAVRSFLEEAGGSISILLKSEASSPSHDYVSFSFQVMIPITRPRLELLQTLRVSG